MNAQHVIYNEHNIECWVERQIDVLDCKYELNQISTEDYHKKMDEILSSSMLLHIEKKCKKMGLLYTNYDNAHLCLFHHPLPS